MTARVTAYACALCLICGGAALAVHVRATGHRQEAFRPNAWPEQAIRGPHAMVATDEPLGSAAGVEVLKRGGNAVDAAVGVAVALAGGGAPAGENGGGGGLALGVAGGPEEFFDLPAGAPAQATRGK